MKISIHSQEPKFKPGTVLIQSRETGAVREPDYGRDREALTPTRLGRRARRT
jgi:hypothetical protein